MAIHMQASAPVTTPVGEGRVSLTQLSHGYAVSGNPFNVPAVLPGIVLATIGVAITVAVATLASVDLPLVGGYLAICLGLLLVSATSLHGSVVITGNGIEFTRRSSLLRKQYATVRATWDQVAGLVYRNDVGLCMRLVGQTQSQPSISLPGGFTASDGTTRRTFLGIPFGKVQAHEALIPLRMFGDRRFAIKQEIQDRVPADGWAQALRDAEPNPTVCRLVYAGVTVIGSAAMVAVALVYR